MSSTVDREKDLSASTGNYRLRILSMPDMRDTCDCSAGQSQVSRSNCSEGHYSDAQNPVNIHYYTLLHITAYITIIEPGILSRIMDNQVRFETHLRDTSGEGGRVCFAHQLHPREMREPSRHGSAIAVAASTAPIATTTTLLIQAEGLETASRCIKVVLREFPGAGLVQRPMKCNKVRPMKCNKVKRVTLVIAHYYTLYYIITSW